MAMLGAELTHLEALAAQLGQSGDQLDGVSAQAQRIQAQVCADLEATFGAAMSQITGTTAELTSAVDAARAQLAATVWTGANRVAFEDAAGDFDTAMSTLAGAVDESYLHFQGELARIAGFMETFQAEVTSSLGEARASTEAMRQAVEVQHTNLDAAMNGAA